MVDASVFDLRRRLLAWGRNNRRKFPWRETDDPFRILVAKVLLQRSRGKTVAAVYERVFARWPDAVSLAKARESSIAAEIRPLGLVRRAATLRDMAKEVVERGGVPSTVEGLLELPGVGPYAAGATAAVAFGRREHVVDGVSARVYRRYFGLAGDGPASNDRELWAVVEAATSHPGQREPQVAGPRRPKHGHETVDQLVQATLVAADAGETPSCIA